MYTIDSGGDSYEIAFEKGSKTKGTINNEPFELDVLETHSAQYHLLYKNKSYAIEIAEEDYANKHFVMKVGSERIQVSVDTELDRLLRQMGMDVGVVAAINELKAPMPGLVLDIEVVEGQTVKRGDNLLVLEAMKMENNLKAPEDAVIKEIRIEKGAAVEKNAVLIIFE